MILTDTRTVLVGMNNPHGDDACHALAPYPARSAGHRLYEMTRSGCEQRDLQPPLRADYLRAFDRRNLLHARAWAPAAAKAAAPELLAGLRGRRVVVLGVATLAALGLQRAAWGAWRAWPALGCISLSLDYCLLPHPSGLCREYNEPEVRRLACELLAREYLRGAD